jgi:serine protease Do
MSTRKTTLFYGVLIVIASIFVGMVIASRLDLSPSSGAQTLNVPATNKAPLGGPIDATTFRNIAKAQTPTVVNISTEARVRSRDMTEFGGEDLLQRYFGFGQPNPRDPRDPRGRTPRGGGRDPIEQGSGTGFVIDKNGFILTNNHVVEGADKIFVTIFGGGAQERYAAKVIGRDPLVDAALIQLTEMPAKPLQETQFGDSDQMQQGDWVMAIGNPFGLGHTVTVGIISATERGLGGTPGRPVNMLQTDAAINPGNSGGPLLNIRGEVVGINTAIYTSRTSASNIGIGFATPINVVKELLPQLRTGKVTRGVIGIGVRPLPLTREEASELGLPNTNGAVVSTVNPDEPADKAGLKPGDVIVEFNGRPVQNNEALVAEVVRTPPGKTVPMTVYRDNKRMTLNVTVGELDLEREAGISSRRGGTEPAEPADTGYGMTLEPITPDIARQLELPRNRGGAIVSDVERNSPASNAGIQPNDVIFEVNRQPATSVPQIQKVLQSVPAGRPVSLLLWRDGSQVFVIMTKR